ncbi:MAG: hypothetical protein JNJ54_10360 [Myxococcaceae bacterium]|nr:hypothetical protein [Myxococcaceae bacterium]
MAVWLVGAVIAEAGWVGVVFSPFIFTFGLVYALPVWGWVVAGVGLALVGASALAYQHVLAQNAEQRASLSNERQAILSARLVEGPVSPPVLTF